MNGHCCQSRLTSLKWPALLALALLLNASTSGPALAAAAEPAADLSRSIQEGPVTLEVRWEKDQIRVAEPLRLTLTARAPRGVSVHFPEPASRLGDFEVTSTEDAFDVPDGTQRTWMRSMQLECLRSGVRELPAITLTFHDTRDATASAATITTPALPVTIVSEVEAGADPTRFRDIKGVATWTDPEPGSQGWVIGTVATAMALALAGLWLIARPRRTLTPAEWALHELDRLETSELVSAGDFDSFFCRVTDILRGYLERRFAIHAPRQTTGEFLNQIEQQTTINDRQRRLLVAFLELADFVKFARFDIPQRDAERALSHCRQFVDSTAGESSSQPTAHTQPGDSAPPALATV